MRYLRFLPFLLLIASSAYAQEWRDYADKVAYGERAKKALPNYADQLMVPADDTADMDEAIIDEPTPAAAKPVVIMPRKPDPVVVAAPEVNADSDMDIDMNSDIQADPLPAPLKVAPKEILPAKTAIVEDAESYTVSPPLPVDVVETPKTPAVKKTIPIKVEPAKASSAAVIDEPEDITDEAEISSPASSVSAMPIEAQTGAYLNQICAAEQDADSLNGCLKTLGGHLQRIRAGEAANNSLTICNPRRIELNELKPFFRGWIDAHPEALDASATAALQSALSEVFPCRSGNKIEP